jgi:hypothetical protein
MNDPHNFDLLDIDYFKKSMTEKALPFFYEALSKIQTIMIESNLNFYTFHAGAYQNSRVGALYKKTYHCTFQFHHLNKNKEFKKILYILDSFEEFIGESFKEEHTKIDLVGQSKEFKIQKNTDILALLQEILKEEHFIYVEHYVMNKNNIFLKNEIIKEKDNRENKIKI